MIHHTVTETELDEWRKTHWVQFAASFWADSKKALEISLDGLYRVTDHGAVRYIGGNKSSAITEYNNAR